MCLCSRESCSLHKLNESLGGNKDRGGLRMAPPEHLGAMSALRGFIVGVVCVRVQSSLVEYINTC